MHEEPTFPGKIVNSLRFTSRAVPKVFSPIILMTRCADNASDFFEEVYSPL